MTSPTKSKPKKNLVAEARGNKATRATTSAARNRAAWETFKSILGAIAIYLVIRTLFVEAYRIPSGSMIPTLLVGDWLFVNKLVYGPTIPFTNTHLPGYSNPKRGDVRRLTGAAGALTMSLREELTDIQYGRRPDPHGWMTRLA